MGPLEGKRVIEMQGIGPGPFCGMMLADLGADVIRVDKISSAGRKSKSSDLLARGRRSIAVDLKSAEGIETVLCLLESADILLEGFRPGVMERLGLGSSVCLRRNPRLVYGRMTGWGQTGPLSAAAGHDINYISLTGALHAIGEPGGKPVPPLNLVGDFGGGGMLLAVGVLAALVEVEKSGQGQVVDAAMTDGSALLMNLIYGMMNSGSWTEERGKNLLDGGVHCYGTYETADGKWISVGSMEPQFYQLLLEKTGFQSEHRQMDRDHWPAMQEQLAGIFKTKTRDQWDEIMLGTDVCYAPVLSYSEAWENEHNRERGTFVEVDGVRQAAPAPRFSRTVNEVPGQCANPGENAEELLAEIGFTKERIASLRHTGAIA